MSENTAPGSVAWIDLTIPDAKKTSDFYQAVIGWKAESVNMGEYDDYNMTNPASGQPMAGICHARGVNADLPAQWLIYFSVENINKSIRRCLDKGGKILMQTKVMQGYGRYCVIEDPAGAVAALFEKNQ